MDDLDDLDLTTLPAVPDIAMYRDPALLGWPPTLPVELALREHTPQELCEGYGIDAERWAQLRADPAFQAAVARYVEMLKQDGMTFKLKAQLQSEALLTESWRIIHNPDIPANVRADLIKYTWKVAGHEPKQGAEGPSAPTFAIQINL